MTSITVAATQMSCGWDHDANLEKAAGLVRDAAAAGAQVRQCQKVEHDILGGDASGQIACEANEHAVYLGPLPDVNAYGYDDVACGHDASGVATFLPGVGSRFWVVVGQNGATEGSYGRDGNGVERPEDGGVASVCTLPQKLTATCP